ncbi:tetratricopeptide repeat protein [Streptomyces sp. NRRL F-5123]|uniref:tetratricopeptide repeat protein n=1 Tax=Streptomyces sp. NRRL F-5123 TaxID=1463856 RepID=UPI0007C531D5|nr:tetratricopeptide repeat protein [Streptomyces sp. NRRL F-5123]
MADGRPVSFGARLRGYRRRVGLSQRELAERAGLGVTTVRDLEQGRTRQPQLPSVRALATALGLDGHEAAALRHAAVVEEPAGEHAAAAEQQGTVRVGLLGPLTLRRGPAEVALGRGGRRLVLARLALSANATVPVHELVDLLWGGHPQPADTHQLLQTYVSRLRPSLDPARPGRTADSVLRLGPGGYRLVLSEQQLDVTEFRELVRAARRADPQDALALLEKALGLWRGFPLADVPEMSAHPLVTALADEQVEAALRYADLAALSGGYGRALPGLRVLAAAHPLHEPLHARLVLALAGAGLQADALAAYDSIRRRLADDLGIDPGDELAAAHGKVLRQEITAAGARPARGRAAPEPPGPSYPAPRQLPAPPRLLTGRVGELADLGSLHDASAVVITAIDGMAGVGKTALAVQAAHRMAHRYPDGQLFIDLHGYTDGVAPVEPGEALGRVLRSLGVPGERIPADVDQRAGLYRSLLADQSVLIVLDNAATEAQVTPLLPGASGCLVLITSRRRLSGLDHAQTLSLDVLPPSDAVALLRQAAGEHRLTGQRPGLVDELAELCGRLPLAIWIAAARLRSHPTWELEHLVGRLRDRQHRLVELTAGQRSVTATLDLSYQDLSADLQRTYRRLGLHLGADFDRYAAAALLDAGEQETGRMLEQLLEAHLLQEPVPGRYRFHDLTRAHAVRTATEGETEADARRAMDRLLDYFRHTASVAMEAAHPHERGQRPQVPAARTPCPPLPDQAAALRWLDDEWHTLLAAARYAEHDRPEYLLHLATTVSQHLFTRGRFHDVETLHERALATARATGHRAAELGALAGLGQVYWFLGRYDRATDCHQQALRLARATGNRISESYALVGLGLLHLAQGRFDRATDHYEQALRLARATGNRTAELDALAGLGHICRLLGRYDRATECYEEALPLARATGYVTGESNALAGLGHVHLALGRYDRATECYEEALPLAYATGSVTGESNALAGLGHVHLAQGRYGRAADMYRRLQDIAHESGVLNWQFEAWQGQGRLQHATGHPDVALTHHERALALATELDHPEDRARAHDGLAHAHAALHQYDQARTHWQRALEILDRLGVDRTDGETTPASIRAHLADSASLGGA